MSVQSLTREINNLAQCTELKDDRIEKYGSLFVFISKKHCHATLKNLLADGRGG